MPITTIRMDPAVAMLPSSTATTWIIYMTAIFIIRTRIMWMNIGLK